MCQRAIKIFISYPRKDSELCDRLIGYLQPLERKGRIEIWRDVDIAPGERWSPEIESKLRSADIILLLVSNHFLASNYCSKIELDIALEREQNNEAIVIPISMSAVDWSDLRCNYLNALPPDRKAVTSWNNEAEAFTDITLGIRSRVIECAYKNVATELDELLTQVSLEPLHQPISQVAMLCKREFHPPEVYECFVDVISEIDAALAEGMTLQKAYLQAATGRLFKTADVSSTRLSYGSEHQTVVRIMFNKFYEKEQDATNSSESDSGQKQIDVHVVLLAMTRTEAEALHTGRAFEAQSTAILAENFERIRPQLETTYENWMDYYNDTPELWCPLGTVLSSQSDPKSLDTLVRKSLEIAARRLNSTYKPDISLQHSYQDVRELTYVHNQKMLEELRMDECVIIIDAISLYHPDILCAFQQTCLDGFSNTFVVTYAPDRTLLNTMKEMIVALEFSIQDMGFLMRNDPDLVDGYTLMPCVVTSEEDRFRSWLNTQMHRTIEDKSRRKGILVPTIKDQFFARDD